MQFAKEVNEAIADLGRRFWLEADDASFFCECDAEHCVERLSLSLSAYEGLRAASRPLLVEGHPLVRATDAVARAQELVDSASALQAQSAQQIARARRNRETGDA